MLNLIEEINVDLIRCKKVIDENNYLETVIAIEELQDKYRDKIKSLDEKSKDIVWNYSMKDLVNIKDSLIEYREEIIEKEKLKNFHEKMLNFKLYLEKNEIENRTVLDKIINIIEEVNNNNISLDGKYEKIKSCFNLIEKFERKTASYILELITLVIS